MDRTPSSPSNPFVLIVAGNRRKLLPRHYAFLRVRLNELLTRHLLHVRLLSDGVNTADKLAERWAEEHGMRVDRFQFDALHPIRDAEHQCLEWMMEQRPNGVVVFAVEAHDARELRRRAKDLGVPVRVVDMRTMVRPA